MSKGELEKRLEDRFSETVYIKGLSDMIEDVVGEARKEFPMTAPYSRDKLKFAHSYIDEILKWKEKWFGNGS